MSRPEKNLIETPVQDNIIYERADGTVERASSAADAIARCPVLGRLAVEAPDQVDILIELAAKGQEVMVKRDEANEGPKKTQTSTHDSIKQKPETPNKHKETIATPAQLEATPIVSVPMLNHLDHEASYAAREITNFSYTKHLTDNNDSQPVSTPYSESTHTLEANYHNEDYSPLVTPTSQTSSEAPAASTQEERLDIPLEVKITPDYTIKSYSTASTEINKLSKHDQIEEQRLSIEITTPLQSTSIKNTYSEQLSEARIAEEEPPFSESGQEDTYQLNETKSFASVIDQLNNEVILGEDSVEPPNKVKSIAVELAVVFQSNLEDEAQNTGLVTDLLELQSFLIEHDSEQYDEERVMTQIEKIIHKFISDEEPIDIRQMLLVMNKDELKELVSSLIDEITRPTEADGREILALNDNSLDVTALDARHKLAKLIFEVIVRASAPTQQSLSA